MTDRLILVLDEGTTSTRAMLFAANGEVAGAAQHALSQHYPADGLVEHDAGEIWEKTLAAARAMVERAGGPQRIAAIGITNQRETVVAWDRATGQPLARAIVWQDRRTAPLCDALRAAGHEDMIRDKTGLLLDPYFSASKMRWLLDNEPAVRLAADEGRLAFGTIESWLVWHLTGGARHITDASNASRTMLLALDGADWDADLLALFGLPRAALPTIVDCCGALGETAAELFGAPIAITGMAGDQQAATIGQGCLLPGQTKATYGTGAFVLTAMGDTVPRSANRLLGTVLCQQQGRRTYALEGSVFVAGSLIKWLRDGLGLLATAEESEDLARSVPDNGGVVLVPALTGLGAPHWRPEARAALTGMSLATTRAHVARAALEAMAHQTADLAAAFAADGAAWTGLRVDGGMIANGWMVQDLADVLALEVIRPEMIETTALGAAMLAVTGAGLFATLEDAHEAMSGPSRRFLPTMDAATRTLRMARWAEALAKV
ncbi:MAG: glycerol kinase GlpK [Alteraurantiacibacter sp.]